MAVNYTLVTLNELTQATSLGGNDLFYTLQFDTAFGYKNEANKTTLNDIINFIIQSPQTGTAISKNAGTNAGEVLLLDEEGKVADFVLPVASTTQKGIIQISDTNFIIENDTLKLSENLEHISSISSSGDLDIETNGILKLNGNDISSSLINGKVIVINADTTSVDIKKIDGLNPAYYLKNLSLTSLAAVENILSVNTDDFVADVNDVKSFKLIFEIPEATEGQVAIDRLTLNFGTNTYDIEVSSNILYVCTVNVLPPSIFNNAYCIVDIINQIDLTNA